MSEIEQYIGNDPNGKQSIMSKITITGKANLSIANIPSAGKHTLHIWIKSVNASIINICQNNELLISKNINNQWAEIISVFDGVQNANISIVFQTSTVYYIWHPKLEKGTIPTDYSKSQDDLQKYTNVSVDHVKTEFNQSLVGFKTEVISTYETKTDSSTKITSVRTIAEQTADKFTWLVKSGTSSSNFTITDRVGNLTAEYINLNGLVSFNGLNTATKNRIISIESNAEDASLTAIAADKKAQNAQRSADSATLIAQSAGATAGNAYSIATSAQSRIASWCSAEDVTYIDGGKIYTGSITADKLFVNDLSAIGATIGNWTIDNSSMSSDVLASDKYLRRVYIQSFQNDVKEDTWIFSVQKGITKGLTPSELTSVWRVDGNGNMISNVLEAKRIVIGNDDYGQEISVVGNIYSTNGIYSDGAISTSKKIVSDSGIECVGSMELSVSNGASNIIMHNNYDRKIYLRLDGSYFYITPHDSNGFDTAHAAYMNPYTGAFSVASLVNRSSKRFKDNITLMEERIAERLNDITVVHFDYKPEYGDKDMYGMIAEDVINIHPNAVIKGSDGKLEGIDYTRFIPLIIKKLQMQEKKILQLSSILNNS